MTWYAHVTVATIVYKENKFLLVYEDADGEKVYNQPAGHLEPQETLIDAAIRETLEETRWQVEPRAYLGISHYTSPANGVTYMRNSFIANPIKEIADYPLDKDIIKPVWLSYDEILERKDELRSPIVLNDIQRFLDGESYPLDIIYTNED